MTLATDCIKNAVLSLRATGASVLVAGLVACGGGGGGANMPLWTLAPTTTYLHYTSVPTTATNVDGTLTTINPAAPTVTTNNPALVGSTPAGDLRVAYVAAATFASGTISNLHRYAVVFASGGVIKKQSAVVSTPAPVAVQISSAFGITSGPGDGTGNAASTDLCTLATIDDVHAPDNSPVYFALAGADRICGGSDDAYFWLRLNSPAGTIPIQLTGLISVPIALYNNSTMAITGFVALNTSRQLTKFDANLANPVVATNGAGPFSTLKGLVPFTTNGHLLLLVDNSIRTYDPATNTLGMTNLATVSQPNRFDNYYYDAATFYFVDNPLPDHTTNVVQRISLTTATPAAATPVVTEAAGALIRYFSNTPNRLVYLMTSGGNHSIQSIVKTATNATPSTPLYSSTATTDIIWLAGSTSTGRVYINRQLVSGPVTAAVTNDDATGLDAHADAKWSTSFSGAAFSIYEPFASVRLSQVILLERNAAGKTTDDGATLTAYNPATHTAGATLGRVPADIVLMRGGFAFSPRALLAGYRTTLLDETDLFYVDVLSAGSLTRVTNDAAVEQVLD